MRHLFPLVVLVVAGWFAVPAQAQTLPDCVWITSVPYTITAPGHYCLKQNISTNLINAIDIQSSNVSLDCRGRSITHTDPNNDAFGVVGGGFGPVHDVTVRACKIVNFATGIAFSPGTERVEILSNDILQPALDGIVLWGSNSRIVGNSILNANDRMGLGHVRNITATAFEPGVRSVGNVITNNVVAGSSGAPAVWGIRVDMAVDVLVSNNQIVDLKPNAGGFAHSISIDASDSARVISNVMMSRSDNVVGVVAGNSLCTRNIAIGLSNDGYVWCTTSVNNSTVP
jgi:hypothetical protein